MNTRMQRVTSSCSSSESSSLTTGLALVRPVRLLRPFPRSPALSFLPRRIFTLTERAGDTEHTERKKKKRTNSKSLCHMRMLCDESDSEAENRKNSRHAYFQTRILPPAPLPLPHSPLPHFPPPSRSFASDL